YSLSYTLKLLNRRAKVSKFKGKVRVKAKAKAKVRVKAKDNSAAEAVVVAGNLRGRRNPPHVGRMAIRCWGPLRGKNEFGETAAVACRMRRRHVSLGRKLSTTIGAITNSNPIRAVNPPVAPVSL